MSEALVLTGREPPRVERSLEPLGVDGDQPFEDLRREDEPCGHPLLDDPPVVEIDRSGMTAGTTARTCVARSSTAA